MSSILKVDQIQLANGNTPTAGDLGINDTGTVLQVVQANLNATVSTTAAAWTNCHSSGHVVITPTSATSKILVSYNIWGIIYGQAKHLTWDLVRSIGGTQSGRLGNQTYGLGSFYTQGVQEFQGTCTAQYLDTPNTTSAITYIPQFNNFNTGTLVNFGAGNRYSTVTAIEIAG